ncbi:hypothetical protein CA51_01440 [Rosistilla oblonga]|uniref:tetratricopeptide repeat protein n=1 Tax=Rosistilla oblonga TaxID=2527990 RepID=UPI0011880478|nr:tetratricopeptide repeat protein [Rosistilla oblonga]QDV10298.1 hypothetical protein CA51_01440 [Rosistilla oblonga]
MIRQPIFAILLAVLSQVVTGTLCQFCHADEREAANEILILADRARIEKRFDEAEPYALQALDVAEQLADPGMLIANANNMLGLIDIDRDRPAEALTHFQSALAALEAVKDAFDPSVYAPNRDAMLTSQGIAAYRSNNFEVALESLQTQLTLRIEEGGQNDARLITTLNSLVTVNSELKQFDDVIANLEQIIAIQKVVAGLESAVVAAATDRLATQLETHRGPAAALPYRQESLRLIESALGPIHLEVINSRYRLAITLESEEKYEEALIENTLAIEAAEKLMGPDSNSYQNLLTHQLVLLEHLEKPDAIQAMQQRIDRIASISKWNEKLAENGEAARADKLDEAMQRLEELQKDAAVFGEVSSPMASIKFHEAALLGIGDRPQEAAEAIREGIAIEQQMLSENHPNIAKSWMLLARFQRAFEQPAAAAESYRAGLDSNEKSGFPDQILKQELLYSLGIAETERGQALESMQALDKCYSLRRELELPYDVRDADIGNRFGVYHANVSGPAKALTFLNRAREILLEVAPDHALLGTVNANIATMNEALANQATTEESSGVMPDVAAMAPAEPTPPALPSATSDAMLDESASGNASASGRDWFWLVIFCIVAAYYAEKRGYSLFLWVFLTLTTSIIVALSVLAILPNRKLQKRRNKELRQLEKLLATTTAVASPATPGAVALDVSIGDQITQN